MGLDGAERIAEYVSSVNDENVDYSELLAAKEYFYITMRDLTKEQRTQ